ncbi:MAG: BTAD domain-containing putative transcriptional regulator, partial [Caldilineaceae bacterium]
MQQDLILAPSATITSPHKFKVFLLGSLRIEDEIGSIRLPRRKVEGLLAYLLLHPEAQSRDLLASLLWGESSDANARHSLRTALTILRQHLGEQILLTTNEHVQLNPNFPIWVDLHELLAISSSLEQLDLARPGWLEKVLTLWQADLLDGFYDDWVTVEREHVRARLLKLFLKITHRLRSQSQYNQAIQVAHQILRFEPANEAAHQHLMFCF